MDRALALLRTLGEPLRRRLACAGIALLGAMVPLVAVTRWPSEIVLFLLLAVGVSVPLALYVLLVRTRIMSTVTGVVLAAVAVVLPMPGYPDFLSGVAGRWGYVLLVLPVLLLAVHLIGWVVDLVVRADRRLGDAGHAPRPGTGVALRPPALPVRPGVARGVASVSGVRPPITVQYVPAQPSPTPQVIDGDVLRQTDHPLE